MPRDILSTTAPGAQDQWAFTGAATSWEAVGYASGDSSYIVTGTATEKSDFFCGSAAQPLPNRVMAVTLHYRIRQTVPGAGTADVKIVQSGTPHTVASVALVGTAWMAGQVRIREDWTSLVRFVNADVGNLGVGVEATAVPASGELQVSELWLAVEYLDTHLLYDPFWGVTPDAVTGPRNFITAGGEPATITGSNYLRIDDTSAVDHRAYLNGFTEPLPYRQGYVTEWELRCTLSNLDVADPAAFAVLGVNIDGLAIVGLGAVRFGGDLQLGLRSAPLGGPLDPGAYLAMEPFNFDGHDLHVRMKIDRDDNPSTYGKVEVFLDYNDTPIMNPLFYDFSPGAPVLGSVAAFGTEQGAPHVCRMDVDYAGWRTYKKRGGTFHSWKSWDFGANSVVGDTTDADIVKPVEINPPGVQVGQSNHACLLDVADVAEPCELRNESFAPDVGPTYKIDVVYKMDIAATEGELVVQRGSDLHYWDEGGGVWDPSFQSVTLSNQLTRTRLAAMTGINVTAPDQQLLVTVSRKTTAGPAYKIFVYKVHLVEE